MTEDNALTIPLPMPPTPRTNLTGSNSRDRCIEIERQLRQSAGMKNVKGSYGYARGALTIMDDLCGRETRIRFLSKVFGRTIAGSKELTASETFALCVWARPTKGPDGTEYAPTFNGDLMAILAIYGRQEEMGLEDE